MTVTLAEVEAARARIRGAAVVTPLVLLGEEHLQFVGAPKTSYAIYLKDETQQPIGSFKLRGATNRIAQLSKEQLSRGVIAYSSGNHAQAVAWAARRLGAKATIVMPETVPAIKRDATAALGAEIVVVGPASSERKQRAEALAAEFGYVVVPPYEDADIIAGAGTCALEILEQESAVDLIMAPVGGGGLLSGIATAAKLAAKEAGRPMQVFGAEPELAADAGASFRAGTQVEWPSAETGRTIADGLRTQSLGALNLQHILAYVDGMVAVSEDEIVTAMRAANAAGIRLEPSGAVGLAALMFRGDLLPNVKAAAVVLSGGNLDPALGAKLLGSQ